MSNNETFTFTAVPTYTRYYKDGFGIYEFYTEQSDIPHLKEMQKECDIWDLGSDKLNKLERQDAVYIGTMLGSSPALDHNLPYNIVAKLEFSEKYKTYQYKIINVSANRPASSVEHKRFLYTILTEKQVNTLISEYPDIVNQIIDDPRFEPDYNKLNGIKEKSFKKIREKILNTYVISDLLVLLQPLGVTYNMILKLLDGAENSYMLKQQLEENPYELTRLHGVGFQAIDKFAIKLKPELLKSKQRVASCIKYLLNQIGNQEGHSWIEITRLTNLVRGLVPECKDVYKEVVQKCRQESQDGLPSFLYVDDTRVSLYSHYNAERLIALKLWELQNAESLYVDVNYDGAIERTNKQNGFCLTEEQCAAVKSVVDNNVTIITGSAGSGKTSIVKAITNMYSHYDIALTALSAKAARRMTEVTEVGAYTIHRLLGWSASGFMCNAENPLYQKLIIVDEASMINSSLFLSLLSAIKRGSKVVIVFDFAQLSPIGVGNIASDLLESALPIHKFTKIHRQAEKSGILVDANKIRVGESPIEEFEETIVSGELQDMHYYFREQELNDATYEQLNGLALKTYKKLLERGVNVDDISVITPRKQSVLNSVNYFNKKLQDMVITDDVSKVDYGDKVFKLGAKVIQKKNNYEKDVVNGEIGYVIDVPKLTKDNTFVLVVDFGEEKLVKYKRDELDQIDLAYAITTHSSQGSQYKYVIVVMDMSHFVLLDSCLFYTSVTRASQECYLVTQPKAFIHALSNSKAENRQTFLKELI